MADRKFSQFTALTEPDLLGTDILVGYRPSGDNIQTSLDALAAYIGSVGGGNVISDGTGETNHVPVFTSDGYHIGNSGLTVSSGIATAQSYSAQGIAPIPGAGTVTVENGSPIVLGDGTSFNSIFGPNSGIMIDGVPYTIATLYGDTVAQLTVSYAGSSASGVEYFYDVSFLNFTNVDGTLVLTVNNSGAINYPNMTATSLTPAIIPQSFAGVTTGLRTQADILSYYIDATSSFNVYDSNNIQLFNIAGGSGNALLEGNLSLGSGSTTGQTLLMPVNSYDFYNNSIASSTLDGLSNLSYFSDSHTFYGPTTFTDISKMSINDPGFVVTLLTIDNVGAAANSGAAINFGGYNSVAGSTIYKKIAFDGDDWQHNITDNGAFYFQSDVFGSIFSASGAGGVEVGNGGSAINLRTDGSGNSAVDLNNGSYRIKGNPTKNGIATETGFTINSGGTANQFAFSVFDSGLGDSALFTDTLNHNFGVIGTDYFVYSAPPSYEELFHVVAKPGAEDLGRVTTRINVLDDGAGKASFLESGRIQLTTTSLNHPLLSMSYTDTLVFNDQSSFNGVTADWDVLSFQATDNLRYKGYYFFGETAASSFNIMTGYRGSVATPGTVTFDIPNTGEFYWWDNVTVAGLLSSEGGIAGIGEAAYLYLQNAVDIPATPSNGVRFFSQFDSGLGHSIAYYKDDDGNVTQIGAGSGGGGTVTDVDVTSDLTVDGTPGGAFSVAATIGLAVTGVTAGFNDFAAVDVDANGRITDIEQRGSFSAADNLLILNGTGVSEKVTLTAGTMVGSGADASNSSIANFLAMGTGAKAGNQGVSVGAGAGNATSGHNEHLFLGYGADATANSLINIAAIGPNSRVSANNTYAYGDAQTPASHGFNTPQALSSLHVVSKTTSGSSGSKGVLRLNGINDAVNTWPVTDKVIQQNALITTGVSAETILLIPISNALDGCITRARIQVSGIINDGSASGAGEISVVGAFDGGSTFYLNAVSSTTPIPITLEPGTTAPFGLPAGTASAQVVLSGTTGGVQNILVQVIGVNATTINWVAWCEYYTTQAVATV